MFKLHMGDTKTTITEEDFRKLGHMADRYSGADIQIVVRDALMQPIRRVQNATHFHRVREREAKDGSFFDYGQWHETGTTHLIIYNSNIFNHKNENVHSNECMRVPGS